MDKVAEFRRIVNEMADLYEKKNKNYGNSFGQLYEDLGAVSGLVPLYNKLHRATTMIKGGKNDFESLEDTFKDLACYAIMNLIEMKEKNEQKTHEVHADNEDSITIEQILKEDKENFDPCNHCQYQNSIVNHCISCPFSKWNTTSPIDGGITYVYTNTDDDHCTNCPSRFIAGACDGCYHAPQVTCVTKESK